MKVKIVNRALSKLGERHIYSFDDKSKTATEAHLIYDMILEAELSSHRWNFAIKRTCLPTLESRPEFGWAFQYQLPSDCLRVLEVGDWPSPNFKGLIERGQQKWVIEGKKILSNYPPLLQLVYIKNIKDPTLYPQLFIEVLASRLAAELAETITGVATKKEAAFKEYEKNLSRAKKWGALQLPPQTIQDDSWAYSRIF